MTYSEKLKDPRWQRKRLEIMERDGFACRNCGDKDKTLHVHHVHYEKGDPWETSAEYLLTVCWECHTYREDIEHALKITLARIMVNMTHEPGGVCDMVSLLHSLEGAKERAIKTEGEDSVFVTNTMNWEWMTDMRWFQHAWDFPAVRKAYDAVTGKKVPWPKKAKGGAL